MNHFSLILSPKEDQKHNFCLFQQHIGSHVVIDVDKMLNAFTMHSFFTTMPSKNVITMPFGTGAFLILPSSERGCPQGLSQKIKSIHLFINLTHSL